MPRNSTFYGEIHAGGTVARPSSRIVPQRTYRQVIRHSTVHFVACWHGPVRVKRRGKSPPLQSQAWRQGKPHRVQGQIGDRGVARAAAKARSRVRLLRQMGLSWRASLRASRQKSAYSSSGVQFLRLAGVIV